MIVLSIRAGLNRQWIIKKPGFLRVKGIILPEKKIQINNKIFCYADVPTCTGKENIVSFPTCNIFYRKKCLIEISCFDKELTYSEDDDLAFRLIKKGYKIHMNRDMKVYHEVRYINLIQYVFKKNKKKRNSSIIFQETS